MKFDCSYRKSLKINTINIYPEIAVKPNCGISKVRPNINVGAESERIGGGLESKPGSWPWTVAIISKLDEKFVCTGTLLDLEWIVTAARCFEK